MPVVKVIEGGDLLEAEEEYIAQQNNCCTKTAKGLAAIINKKYPWADVYSSRKDNDVPGTIKIVESPDKTKKVISMFGQFCPGKPGAYNRYYPNTYSDTKICRKKYFQKCLDTIDSRGIKKVAMPYLIGCDMAGGKWGDYEEMLNNCKFDIVLYKKK